MPKPALTVVMPVYNSDRFLAQAIDSVLNQSFTDFEFLILDDGSTDTSVSIVQSYTDPRIRFYQNDKNLGISPTLNKGIALASSNLIARMDADDLCYPERLQKQFAYMAAHPECALVSCGVRVISETGEFIRQDRFKSEFYYYNLNFICWIYHPTIVFRKQAVEQIGGYTVPYAEDFELFWQLSRHFKIHAMEDILMDYRVSTQSLHQVLKKKEYEVAQQEQILRNIRYYTGQDFTLPEAYLECLQHNFTPLQKLGSVVEIVKCVQALEYISQKMQLVPNPNLVPAQLKQAAFFKRRFIVSYFQEHLPLYKALLLTFKTKSWKELSPVLKKRLKALLKH